MLPIFLLERKMQHALDKFSPENIEKKFSKFLSTLTLESEIVGYFGEGFPNSFYKIHVRPRKGTKWRHVERTNHYVIRYDPIEHAKTVSKFVGTLADLPKYEVMTTREGLVRLRQRALELTADGSYMALRRVDRHRLHPENFFGAVPLLFEASKIEAAKAKALCRQIWRELCELGEEMERLPPCEAERKTRPDDHQVTLRGHVEPSMHYWLGIPIENGDLSEEARMEIRTRARSSVEEITVLIEWLEKTYPSLANRHAALVGFAATAEAILHFLEF